MREASTTSKSASAIIETIALMSFGVY